MANNQRRPLLMGKLQKVGASENKDLGKFKFLAHLVYMLERVYAEKDYSTDEPVDISITSHEKIMHLKSPTLKEAAEEANLIFKEFFDYHNNSPHRVRVKIISLDILMYTASLDTKGLEDAVRNT